MQKYDDELRKATREWQTQYMRKVKDKKLGTVLNDLGYENTKAGRDFIERFAQWSPTSQYTYTSSKDDIPHNLIRT